MSISKMFYTQDEIIDRLKSDGVPNPDNVFESLVKANSIKAIFHHKKNKRPLYSFYQVEKALLHYMDNNNNLLSKTKCRL